ncbi:hypothetical protein ACMFMG_010568 [Clarireedia jacksonii]
MQHLAKQMKEKLKKLDLLKRKPKAFRDALISEQVVKRLTSETENKIIGLKEDRREVLENWQRALSEASEKERPIDERPFKDRWQQLATTLSEYRKGPIVDAENFEAYCYPDEKIRSLERELDDDELMLKGLACMIGLDSMRYLKSELPRHYK